MQQILQQLQQGTQEVVKDHGDGRLDIKINPPSALNLRAARLIVQLVNERDQVVNANVQLNAQLHQALQEIDALNSQLKDIKNATFDSRPIPETDPKSSDSTN